MSQSQPPHEQKLDMSTTKTMELQVQREEQKPKYFFIRRMPLRKVPREWTRPPEKEYKKQLLEQGFISEDLLKGPMSPELKADVRELEQHLLPHFWRVHQEALYYQNRYYQYQWVFILAAFLTTALASTTVLVHALDGQNGFDTGTFIGTLRFTELFGFLAAVLSGMAATVSFLDANQTPQNRWFKARAQAESLRSLYFLFLARQNPFDLPDARSRVQELRRAVLDVLVDSPSREQVGRPTRTSSFRAAPSRPGAGEGETKPPPDRPAS